MNRIYRLCWNRSLSQWVAASELASCKRSGASRSAVVGHRMMMFSLLSASLGMTGLAHAGNTPTGGQVIAGSGQILQSGNTTTIQQNSRLLSLNWQSFDVGADQTVNFLQPGASSIAVNRILGNTSSEIFGHLNANGQVWLINPNGVLFGQNAQVNVGGIVASTLDLDASSLGSDSVRFGGSGKGKVTNQGSITAANGGYVALIGNQVSNQGVIRAQLGTVALGGGSAVTLTFSDNHLLHLEVNASTLNNLAENRQLIVADGGQVLMTAGARDSLLASAVNNTGTVQARSVQDHDGVITLLGGMEAGTVNVGGTLDASAPNGGNGGQIETSAAHFALASDVKITAAAPQGKAGTWLIDPVDLTIDSTAADSISGVLNSGTSVTEQTTSSGSSGAGSTATGAGDINLNADATISWNNSAGVLTFDAFHDINVNGKITGTGGVNMNATAGTLTIGNAGGISAGTGATVNASKFVNNAGANALGPNWLAYTASPLTNTLGGLTPNYIQYNANISSTLLGTGNGLIYSFAPTFNVTGLKGTVSKVYDNTNAASGFTGANFNTTGLVNGDTIGGATGGSYATVNAGSGITVTAPGLIGNFSLVNGSIPVFGYTLGTGTITGKIGTITPAPLTAQIIGNPTKVYDGTTTATLGSSNYEIDGFFGTQGATVKQPSSIAYAGSDAGSVALNATFSVTNFVPNAGTNLANYILPTVATGMGTISQAPLLISGLLGTSKTYDGNTSDTIDASGAKLFGVIQPDINDVHLDTSGITGTFAQFNVGSGLGVSAIGYLLTGNKASNYLVVAPSGLFANITPKQLTIDQVLANNKTYDNTVTATLNTGAAVLDGVIGTDDVTLSTTGASARFGQTDVGSNLAVSTLGFTLGGAAQGNYMLAQPSLFANITPALLTITMTGSPLKTYDGTAAVTLGSGNFNIAGFIGSQGGTVAQSSATYATANAGNNINVTATLQPSDFAPNSGTSMSNYTFATSVLGSGLGTINPLQLSGQIINNPTKVYDGTTAANLVAGNYELDGFVGSDNITVTQTHGIYDDKNAGVRGVSATLAQGDFQAAGGTLLSNYVLPIILSGFGTITPAPVSIGIVAAITGTHNKIYDGTTDITIALGDFQLSGFAPGESASVNKDITGEFANKNVGSQPIFAFLQDTDFTFSGGANLGNYTFPVEAFGTGAITRAPLTVTITGNPTKVYNGSRDVSLNSSNFLISGFAGTENGSINPTATAGYDSANAGPENITATLTSGNYNFTNGALLSNYQIATVATGPGTINQAPLFVTGVFATNKTYNADNSDTLNFDAMGLAGLVDTDAGNVNLIRSNVLATFGQKNVGNGLAVTAVNFQIAGSAQANYVLQPVTGLFANITPASLTLSGITANDKTYDGNTLDSLTIAGNAALAGIFAGDTVGFDATNASGTFNTSNAGTGLKVSTAGFQLTGASESNYQLVQPNGLTATINQKPLTAVITGSPTKVYDGTNSATLTQDDYELDGFVLGDNATIPQSATANYATKDVGNGLGVVSTLVTSDFLATGGTNLANYILPTAGAGSNGIIQPKVIDLTGMRIYDGTPTADGSLFGQLAGVNGETVTVNGSGTLVNRNVGTEWAFTTPNGLGSLALADGTNGGLGSNYTLVGGTDWVTITPRALTATFTAEDKTYDGNTAAILQGAALEAATGNAGLVAGDDVSLINPTAGLFNNKNAGTGKAVTGNMSIGGDDAGNYTFTQGTATANIDQLHISVTATGKDKQYDGLTHDDIILAGDHVVAGDTVNFSSTASNFLDPNVANGKTVNVSGITASGTDAGNYILDNTAASTTANILPRIIDLSGMRTYDGTTTAGAASFNGGTVQGQNGDTLSLTGNFTLTSKNVGTYSWMDGGTLALADGTGLASNYTLLGGTDTYTVTARALTASFDADDKVYNGNTVAALENALLQNAAGNQGLIAGDKVTLTNGTVGSFDNKNAGTGKTVTGNMGITGDDAANYIFTNGTSTADITKATLTVTAMGSNKIYDGNINDTVTLQGGVTGDDLTFNSTSATFGDKNVGDNKTVTVNGITVGGGDAVNYTLANTDTTTHANITPVILNLQSTRVYDGTTGAANSLFVDGNGQIAGINGEMLELHGAAGVLVSKNVGKQDFANLGDFSLADGTGGGLGGNYTLVGGMDWVTITPKALTATTTVKGRFYDGTTNIALIGSALSGLVGGDDVVLGNASMGTFADKNAAFGKAVTTNMTVSGDDAGNYTFTTPTGLVADVTPLAINVDATALSKMYDTTTNVTINPLTSNGVLGSDVVNFAFGSAAFDDANAANGKTVTVNGITKSGADAGNYTINTTAQTTADITRVVLDLSGTRVYDGSTGADASLFGSNGVLAGIGGQTLNLSGSGVAGSKNVGTLPFAGLGTLALADGGNGGLAGNYTLVGGTDTLMITPKALTATTTVKGRFYDGTTNIALIGSALSGLVGGDDVVLGNATMGTFADKNAAFGKAVTTNMTVSGDDAGNYTFTTPTGLVADVTPLAINVDATALGKMYDTTTNVTINSLTSNGVLGSDVVNFAFGSANFADANAAIGKVVTVNGITKSGTDAGNYTINTTAQTTADITRVVLDLSGTRVYDGSTGADASLFGSNGVLAGIGGETLNLSGSGVAGSKNVGTLPFAGLGTLALADGGNGGLAGNYTLVGGTDTLTINPKAITIGATGDSKTYDATTAATVHYTDNGVVGGDDIDFTGTANFAGANAGNGISINVNGIAATGADALNYTYNTTAMTSANITPVVLDLTGTRVYDGGTGADAALFGANGVLAGINGETVNLSGSGVLNNKNVGNNKPFAGLGSLALGDGGNGGLAGNYTLLGGTDSVTVTQKTITVGATGSDKTYDGNSLAGVTLNGNGVIGGDQIGFTPGSANYAGPNAGTGIAITVNGITGTGADAGNYAFNTTAATSGTITPAILDLTGTRTYDGTSGAAASLFGNNGVLTGVNGETLTLNGTGTVSDKSVGSQKGFANGGLNGFGLSGNGAALAGNYTLAGDTDWLSITPAMLTIVGTTTTDRTYDGTKIDALSGSMLSGLFGNDDVTLGNTATGLFDTKNVGKDKSVTTAMTIAGGDVGNYILVQPVGLTANVTPRPITVNATGTDKYFDGNTTDQITLGSDGVIAGDQLGFTNQGANFSDSAVDNGKTVTVTGIQGNGADAGNYVIADPTTTTTADIMGGQASAFGIDNASIAQLQGVVGPSAIDTPYGVADQGTVGSFTGNQKKQHRPLERNRARTDFKSGLALSVVDGGVQMPANEMP